MKKTFYILTFVVFSLVSCDKEDVATSKQVNNDYSSEISTMRVSLAKDLIQSISENPQLEAVIVDECNKKFDGDADVLCKNLLKKSLVLDNNSKIEVGQILKSSHLMRSAEATDEDYLDALLEQDSLVQVYYYSCNDTCGFEGIVVIPEDAQENDGKYLMVINKDGTEEYISSDGTPDKNYLVVSRNERSEGNDSTFIDGAAETRAAETGKKMKITRAKFTSIGAKRTVESWWGGEPEVRVNILYPYMNPVTKNVDEVRNTTFLYPEKWIKHGLFKNGVKWNNSLIECAYWSINELPYGRRIIWTEEDGARCQKDVFTTLPNNLTGVPTTITTKIPATNKDEVFADKWIDYYATPAGILTWSIIQFDLSFE